MCRQGLGPVADRLVYWAFLGSVAVGALYGIGWAALQAAPYALVAALILVPGAVVALMARMVIRGDSDALAVDLDERAEQELPQIGPGAPQIGPGLSDTMPWALRQAFEEAQRTDRERRD